MAKNFQRETKFPGLMDDLKPVSKHTHTHTSEPTQVHTPTPRVKEYKQHRVQMLLKPSMVESLDQHAKAYNVSRTEIVQALIGEYLSDEDLRVKIESKLFQE